MEFIHRLGLNQTYDIINKKFKRKKATDQVREKKNQVIVLPKRESDLPGCHVVGLSFCFN